jgi:hypothetical protein
MGNVRYRHADDKKVGLLGRNGELWGTLECSYCYG